MHPMDLGGGTTETSTLLPTQTIRQSNYDDALRVSHSASLSIINPIARSANIQLEEIYVHEEKSRKGPSPITSPNSSNTKTKNHNNRVGDSFNRSSKKNDDVKSDVPTKVSQILESDKFKFEKNDFGVISKDSKLNKDAKELYEFFMLHNDKPEMF